MKVSRRPHMPRQFIKVKPVKPHSTKKIIIKMAEIDKEMIPVVKWLNKFESVITKFCCQGEDSNEIYNVDAPYVVFSCDQSMDLLTIVEKVGYTGVVEIRPPNEIRLMDYSIRFPNKENLKHFIKRLKNEV